MGVLVDFVSQSIHFFYTLASQIGLANYGIAIIIFTLVVKLILLPLTKIQVNSMKNMQEIQPKIKELQKKYKNNQQKQQEETMKLYKETGVNPFAGCLPLVVQMPILWSLFASLREFFNPETAPAYVNLEHATFLWVGNLGNPDPFILPILAALFTFLQQKVSMPATVDQTQKTMLYIMPLFMGWISRSFPAALALYWVAYSVFSTLEQWWLRRRPAVIKEEASAK